MKYFVFCVDKSGGCRYYMYSMIRPRTNQLNTSPGNFRVLSWSVSCGLSGLLFERIMTMKTVELAELLPDNRNDNYGYLPRSYAEKLGLKIGDVFAVDCGDEKFKIVSKSVYREDIHKAFDGFTCQITIGS